MSRFIRHLCRRIVRIEARNDTKRKVEVEHMEHPVKSNGGLIPVFAGEIGGVQCNVCNARDLHAFLQVGKVFAAWIRDRIQTYGFIEGEDYSSIISKSGNNSKRGPNFIDYHLTLDTAKEIAMVEKNEQGRQARRYFIECERKALDAAAGVKQQLGNQLPALVEKACDMTSWRLANEYQQRTITLIGEAAHPGDDEMLWTVAFLIRKRLYDRLAAIAKELLRKNTPEEDVVDILLSWGPQA